MSGDGVVSVARRLTPDLVHRPAVHRLRRVADQLTDLIVEGLAAVRLEEHRDE